MSRYDGNDCRYFITNERARLEGSVRDIELWFKEMEFENANEKETAEQYKNEIVRTLNDLISEISSYGFE